MDMGGIGSIISSASGNLHAKGNMQIGHYLGKRSAHDARTYDRESWIRDRMYGPLFAMKGLRKAGLNPILAAGNPGGGMSGTHGGPMTPVPSGSASSAGDLGESFRAQKLLKEQLNNIAADTGVKEEQKKQAAETTKNIRMNTLLTAANVDAAYSQNVESEIRAQLYKDYPWLKKTSIIINDLFGNSPTFTTPNKATPQQPQKIETPRVSKTPAKSKRY